MNEDILFCLVGIIFLVFALLSDNMFDVILMSIASGISFSYLLIVIINKISGDKLLEEKKDDR